MKIWIVTIGEPSLLDFKDSRLLRSEIFSDKLIKKGIKTSDLILYFQKPDQGYMYNCFLSLFNLTDNHLNNQLQLLYH